MHVLPLLGKTGLTEDSFVQEEVTIPSYLASFLQLIYTFTVKFITKPHFFISEKMKDANYFVSARGAQKICDKPPYFPMTWNSYKDTSDISKVIDKWN